MSKLEELAERVDRLVLLHVELKRTTQLLEQQLASVRVERDSLRSRLSAARARVEALLARIPSQAAEAAAPAADDAGQPTGSTQ